MALFLVEGWTDRITYALKADTTPVDLTDCSVEFMAFTAAGVRLPLAGSFGILGTPTDGNVYFDPGAADIRKANSPYQIRWKVTNSSGARSFYPNGNAEQWTVFYP